MHKTKAMNPEHLKTVLREAASKEHKALIICATQNNLDETRRQLEALAIPMEVDRHTRNLTARVRTMDGLVSTIEMMVLPNDTHRAAFALAGRHPSQVFTDEMVDMSLAQYGAVMDRFPLAQTKGGDVNK